MTLIQHWARNFTTEFRARGGALQRGGNVKQLPAEGPEEVRAAVNDGGQTHLVLIQELEGEKKATCDCEAFLSTGEYCPHIWAVICDIKQKGVLHPNENAGQDETATDERPTITDEATEDSLPSNPSSPSNNFILPKARKRETPRGISKRASTWDDRMSMLRPSMDEVENNRISCLPNESELFYIIDAELSMRGRALVIHVKQRSLTRAGWSKLKPFPISLINIDRLPDAKDREICSLLLGGARVNEDSGELKYKRIAGMETIRLPLAAQYELLKAMVNTDHLHIQYDSAANEALWVEDLSAPLRFDEDDAWKLWAVGTENHEGLRINVELRRHTKVLPLSKPMVIIGGDEGVIIYNGMISRFDDREAFAWVRQFREDILGAEITPLFIPKEDIERFVDRLYLMSHLPEIELPEHIVRDEHLVTPVPCIELYHPGNTPASTRSGSSKSKKVVSAELWFEYAGFRVSPMTTGRFVSSQPSLINSDAAATPGLSPAATQQDTASSKENPSKPSALSAEITQAPLEATEEQEEKVEATELEPAQAKAETSQDSQSQDSSEEPVVDIEDQDSDEDAVLIRRDRRREAEAANLLVKLGFCPDSQQQGNHLQIDRDKVNLALGTLLRSGWLVKADRQMIYQPSAPSLSITSGIDWFELRGTIKYQTDEGEQEVALPQILKAIRSGQNLITLGDGSQGMLPEEWLEENSLLTSIAEEFDDHLRFKSKQAILLDHLLNTQNMLQVDDSFERIRQGLRQFEGIHPQSPNEGFKGELRPYQREGLGWLQFLVDFGIGGILADDMGLGKTVQMLALIQKHYSDLASRQREHELTQQDQTPPETGSAGTAPFATRLQHRPSLVVAPKSVVFNWVDEAEKFSPALRVIQYAGPDRHEMRKQFNETDIIITSYGLLRRDIEELRKIDFELVILDEAQAIKNPSSQAAKAARIVQGQNNIALTGTPVENHLGDLWSIFEFVNPGLLGAGSRFQSLFRGSRSKPGNLEIARQTGQALRPFILRRTKQQVSRDLPDKTEQTIICEMDTEQRKIYDDLRAHYRRTLLEGKTAGGKAFGDNAMVVLEALLRLRQASCHPALIDPTRPDAPSAKMDTLMEQLTEIIDQGHKALVFSQFTSMLGLVRHRLDAKNMTYEYLDGKTRDRKKRVHRFQTDPHCGIFLISLKAGGLGLNLTAAEYVFILDPWWNPAVEAQAIDRAHRIGQTRHVFAYRLICKDTVEQRIADLQNQKRELADAIVGGQDNVLKNLTREDLDTLLS